MDLWDTPLYSPAEAARYVGLSTARVRRWLSGYHYTYSVCSGKEIRSGAKGPLVHRDTCENRYASFSELIDLLFIKSFLNRGFTLQRIRKALDEVKQIFGGNHFSHKNFFSDGRNIYLEVKDSNHPNLLQLLSRGQWVIAPIIKQTAEQIIFDARTGFATKWYPFGISGLIVLDPDICFGAPSIVNRGMTTHNIFDLYVAEKRNINKVCSWMSLRSDEVESAVKFEERLAA